MMDEDGNKEEKNTTAPTVVGFSFTILSTFALHVCRNFPFHTCFANMTANLADLKGVIQLQLRAVIKHELSF